MSVRMVRLEDVCEINPRAPKNVNDDTPVSFLPMSAVSEDGYVSFEEARTYGDVKKGYTYFERGDVLVAKITPCFENGKAASTETIENKLGFGSTEFHVLRPSKNLDPKYIFYLIWSERFRKIGEKGMTGSAGQKRVPADLLRRLEIPLPPLDEQKRIAAILDKADALRAKRRQAIALLDGLTQSIFLEMFGDPVSNPKGWDLCRIEDFLESANYGSSGKAGPTGRYPILRMGNVTFDGRIDTTDLKYIDLSENEVPKYTVRKGDLLFNRTNSADLVGKTAIFDLDDKYAFAGYLVRARTNERATPEYISAYLNSPYGKGLLRGMAKSIVGMANINAKEMQKISIPAPPKTLQDQFSVKLKRVAEMRHRILPSVVETETLFTSLQHRALTGQL